MTVLKISNFISEDEAQFFRDYVFHAISNPSRQVQLANKKSRDETWNKNKVDRLYYSINSPFWLFDKIRKIAEKNWNQNITFRNDSYAHIMHYLKDSEGLGWHTDGNMGWVSASVNITPDHEYEGGDFEVEKSPKFTCKYREMVMYSCSVRHRVTPLIGGEKMSLVLWLPKVEQDCNTGFQWKYD